MMKAMKERIKPKRERGLWAWIKRWLFCGYREDRRTMRIYMEICQMDDLYDNEKI